MNKYIDWDILCLPPRQICSILKGKEKRPLIAAENRQKRETYSNFITKKQTNINDPKKRNSKF